MAEAKPFRQGRFHSISSCKMWETCPRQYRYTYVDHVKTTERDVPQSWRFGTCVHAAMEGAFKAQIDRRSDGPMADNVEAGLEALRVSWAKEDMPVRGGQYEDAIGIVRATLDHLGPVNFADILGVEHKFLTTTEDGANFVGYADLILRVGPSSLLVRDWKVSRWAKDAEYVSSTLQLNMYGWASREEWPWAETVYVSEYYPPINEEVMVALDPEVMIDTLARFEADVEAIEIETEYVPQVGDHCRTCSFTEMCPAITSVPKEQLNF